MRWAFDSLVLNSSAHSAIACCKGDLGSGFQSLWNLVTLPSDKIQVIATRFSRVTPYIMELLPELLFPTIPPRVARFEVDVSGPNMRLYSANSRFRTSLITPGSTMAMPFSLSMLRIRFMYREVSMTSPLPTHCPASDVPPPLGIRDLLSWFAQCIRATRSS